MLYGLIGAHLTHSYSPEIHSEIADYSYGLTELGGDELRSFMEKRDFRGINVTIPYKQAVMPYLDSVSPEAERIGAVNTIVNRGGRLYGYNTDCAGMEALILRAGLTLGGRKVLVLGTGGASKAAVAAAEGLGAREVILVSRSGKGNAATYGEAEDKHRDADILINTTPVGMYPETDKSPVGLQAFGRLGGVIDAIYNPLRTNLVLNAAERGIRARGGLYMLSAQAVESSALFRDAEADAESTYRVYRAVLDKKMNISLIGMPSCGKTTVGRRLAGLTGKTFVDTDEEIIKAAGMPIADYFAKYGEPAFRSLEREAVRSATQRNGCVVATGGGAVLDSENVRALKHNGAVIFIDRSVGRLTSTPDRPLSSSREALLRLFNERYALYRAASDARVDGDGTVEETAILCKEAASSCEYLF